MRASAATITAVARPAMSRHAQAMATATAAHHAERQLQPIAEARLQKQLHCSCVQATHAATTIAAAHVRPNPQLRELQQLRGRKSVRARAVEVATAAASGAGCRSAAAHARQLVGQLLRLRARRHLMLPRLHLLQRRQDRGGGRASAAAGVRRAWARLARATTGVHAVVPLCATWVGVALPDRAVQAQALQHLDRLRQAKI
eukprot:359833-Chlamydomonas_euryale.AAC.18